MPESPPPPSIEGLGYSRLQALEAAHQQHADHIRCATKKVPDPEGAPVASDAELLAIRSWLSHRPVLDSDLGEPGRQHGAAQPPAQPLAAQPPAAQPPAALPPALSDALISAECALSDIAEGEETNTAPNSFKWAEQRCAEALAIIRPVMQQHGIRTSEFPPTAQPTLTQRLTKAPMDAKGYADLREPTLPTAPAGGLVERLQSAVRMSGGSLMDDEWQVVIRQTAAWLRVQGLSIASNKVLLEAGK